MSDDYPCATCRYEGVDMLGEPCAHCEDYRRYAAYHGPDIDSPYTGSDDPDLDDMMERLIKELSRQLDRINDHLAGIEEQLDLMVKSAPITEWRREHGSAPLDPTWRDRP